MSRALILLALLCAGCDSHPQPPLWLAIEPETGCQWLIQPGGPWNMLGDWKAVVRPMTGADGKQICGKGK